MDLKSEMVLCKHLVDAALKADKSQITIRDVKHIYESVILDTNFAHCLSIWESMPTDLRQDVIFAANATGDRCKLSKEVRMELRKLGLLSDEASDSTLPEIFTDWVRKNGESGKRTG